MSSGGAHARDFVWTYEWATPSKFEKEIELWHSYRSDRDRQQGQLEFEYGVSDRWAVAPYLLYSKSPGRSWKIEGWKFETRYAFGGFAQRTWLSGAYLEIKKERGNPYELEAKGIWSYYRGERTCSLNLIAEKGLRPGADWVLEWAVGVSGPLSRDQRWTVEAFGNVDRGTYFAGPGWVWDLDDESRLDLNVAAGLNGRSDDFRVRLIYEHEWE